MKTTQAYYHNGKFLFNEKGWPVEPAFTEEYYKYFEHPEIERKVIQSRYQQALTTAISESVEYEDYLRIAKMVITNLGIASGESLEELPEKIKRHLKDGVYSIPEIEGEYIEVGCEKNGHCRKLFRIVQKESNNSEKDKPELSLQSCKDQIARKYGYKSWESLRFSASMSYGQHDSYWSEVAELYRSSSIAEYEKRIGELKKYNDQILCDAHDNEVKFKELTKEVERLKAMIKEAEEIGGYRF